MKRKQAAADMSTSAAQIGTEEPNNRTRLHGRMPGKYKHGPHWPLVEKLIRRRHALGFSQLDVDFIAGWPEGYCGKLEAGIRRPGLDLFYEWLQTLKCEVVIRPAR